MTRLFGIKNCDTVKKARRWLEEQSLAYEFHDVRSDGLSENQVQQWLDKIGMAALINKRSTTWKQLSESTREGLNEENVIQLILDNPTLIKRPVLEYKEAAYTGFKAADYEAIFSDS